MSTSSFSFDFPIPATVRSNNADRIVGVANENNLILGLGGGDTITGGNMSDLLDGGAGNDSLSGLGDIDLLFGGDGADTLNGGNAPDILIGGTGNDLLLGGSNSFPEETDEELPEIDILYGGDGNDVLRGEGGVDILIGAAGGDRLVGGTDDDFLFGGEGNDTLTGGAGDDVFIFSRIDIDAIALDFGIDLDDLDLEEIAVLLNDISSDSPWSVWGDWDWWSGYGKGSPELPLLDFSAIGVDTITDFNVSDDEIVLDPFSFPELTGYLTDIELFDIVTTNGQAQTSPALIVYNRVNGQLFYNQNGSEPGFFDAAAVYPSWNGGTPFGGLFARLPVGLNLTTDNFDFLETFNVM